MAQEQRRVLLRLDDGTTGQAAATGNNAAWMCPCGRALPLVGRSDPSRAGEVICPDCGRKYAVKPEAGSLSKVREVTAVAAS